MNTRTYTHTHTLKLNHLFFLKPFLPFWEKQSPRNEFPSSVIQKWFSEVPSVVTVLSLCVFFLAKISRLLGVDCERRDTSLNSHSTSRSCSCSNLLLLRKQLLVISSDTDCSSSRYSRWLSNLFTSVKFLSLYCFLFQSSCLHWKLLIL